MECHERVAASPVQVLAAKETARDNQGKAAAELEAATRKLKEQIQQLQGSASTAESRAAAAEKEAAKARALVKSQADQLCSARAEAASYKKEAMSLVDRVSQLDKSSKVMFACIDLSAVCWLELLTMPPALYPIPACCAGAGQQSQLTPLRGWAVRPLGWLLERRKRCRLLDGALQCNSCTEVPALLLQEASAEHAKALEAAEARAVKAEEARKLAMQGCKKSEVRVLAGKSACHRWHLSCAAARQHGMPLRHRLAGICSHLQSNHAYGQGQAS